MQTSEETLPVSKEIDASGLQHDLEKLQQSHDVLMHQLEERNGMVEKLHLQLNRCLEDNEDLKRKLDEKENDLKTVENILQSNKSRIQELEESEIKLNKMKALAVKLKKELAEAKSELNNEKNGDKDMKELLKQTNKDKEKIAALYQQSVKNFQNLQSEYDLLQDDFENTKKQLKVKETDLNSLLDVLNKTREDLAESKLEVSTMKTLIANLRSAEEDRIREKKELESRIIVLQSELAEERRKVVNQAGLEQSLIEMKNQIDLKTTENAELSEQVEQLLSRDKQASLLEAEVGSLRNENQQLGDRIKELEAANSDLIQRFEQLSAQNEEEKLQKIEYIEENTNLKQKLTACESNFGQRNKILATSLKELKERLSLAEDELKRKDDEFNSYKVRVCKVLNEKTVNPLESKVKELESLVETLKVQLSTSEESMVSLQLEKTELQNTLTDVRSEMKQLKERLEEVNAMRQENDTLKVLSRDLQYKLVSERSHHEKTTQDLKEQHSREVATLHEDIKQLEENLRILEETHVNRITDSSASTTTLEDNKCASDAAELESLGSASLPSKTKRLSGASSLETSVNPLHEILNSDKKYDFDENGQAEAEQVLNLRSLLEESESNNLLLAEQNRVLKEEIRRLERSIERLELADNLEYLKNVLMKFVTLESGSSEKQQLVPVLKTVLKLTSEEVTILESVNGAQQHQLKDAAPHWSGWVWNGFN